MYIIELKTRKAKQWINDNVQAESWQFMAGNLVVDHHYIEDLAYGMKMGGLTLKDINIIHA
jgi:hypothetical protein